MRNKETKRLMTLRLINAAIKDLEISLRGEGTDREIADTDVVSILERMVKQRKESARAYEEGGRIELAEQELTEIGIVREFLPRQLNDDEAAKAIADAIAATGAASIRDMGKVMGELKSKFAGQMDFGAVGPMVKSQLS
jgi:uncharacterized protein YqeY